MACLWHRCRPADLAPSASTLRLPSGDKCMCCCRVLLLEAHLHAHRPPSEKGAAQQTVKLACLLASSRVCFLSITECRASITCCPLVQCLITMAVPECLCCSCCLLITLQSFAAAVLTQACPLLQLLLSLTSCLRTLRTCWSSCKSWPALCLTLLQQVTTSACQDHSCQPPAGCLHVIFSAHVAAMQPALPVSKTGHGRGCLAALAGVDTVVAANPALCDAERHHTCRCRGWWQGQEQDSQAASR